MWRSIYFTLAELTFSQTAEANAIDNRPPPDVEAVLAHSATLFDSVRRLLGKPVLVSSGYRSPKLNALIGGSPTSAHPLGYAFDFTCPGFGTPQEICQVIAAAKAIRFDQLIMEKTWVHISFDPRLRRQLLTGGRGVPVRPVKRF